MNSIDKFSFEEEKVPHFENKKKNEDFSNIDINSN